MPKLPTISGKEMLNWLQKNGFIISRAKGSHFFLKNEGMNTRTTVPVHGKEPLRPGLLMGILSDIEVSKDYFCEQWEK